MKIADGYVLRQVCGENIVVSTGDRSASFKGMITLNDSAAFLWQRLQTACSEQDLLEALDQEYEIEVEQAKRDLVIFISRLREADLLVD